MDDLDEFIDNLTDDYQLTQRELEFINRAYEYGKYVASKNIVESIIFNNPE